MASGSASPDIPSLADLVARSTKRTHAVYAHELGGGTDDGLERA